MTRFLLPLALLLGTILVAHPIAAADPPTNPNLVLAGISFDDPPLPLPVTPNLQQALNQIAGDIGRHCAKQEAYGWRLQQTEQERVNGIFSDTATKLNGAGYNLVPQTPPSATRDITIFLAERAQQDLLFLWSAGELGLVLLVCEAQSSVTAIDQPAAEPVATEPAPSLKPSAKVKQPTKPKPVAKSKAEKPKAKAEAKKPAPAIVEPSAIAIDDLPPVVREATTAAPLAPAAPKTVAVPPLPNVTPEVKAMLESLPEAPPAVPEPIAAPDTNAALPAPLPVDDAIGIPADVPTMVVPPTQQ
jgi:hypothetical protein